MKPEEIIVVIPEGYSLDYKLENETIIYSQKGMVSQRAVGISYAKSKYILVVDDDIEFEENMIERLYDFMIDNNLNCCLPMEGYNDNSTSINVDFSLFTKIRGFITGQLFTCSLENKFLDLQTRFAGRLVYTGLKDKNKVYLCDSACFQCFFIETELAKKAHFEEDAWLQEGTISKYTAYDEPVFFAKIRECGLRMAYNFNVFYKNLDEKTGHKTKTKLEEKRIRCYSIARNRTIYWYKYIYTKQNNLSNKLLTLLAGTYSFINYFLYTSLINISPKNWSVISAMIIGFNEAYKVCKAR